jgi:hypothetical protein
MTYTVWSFAYLQNVCRMQMGSGQRTISAMWLPDWQTALLHPPPHGILVRCACGRVCGVGHYALRERRPEAMTWPLVRIVLALRCIDCGGQPVMAVATDLHADALAWPDRPHRFEQPRIPCRAEIEAMGLDPMVFERGN